jgi:hypothetical protein
MTTNPGPGPSSGRAGAHGDGPPLPLAGIRVLEVAQRVFVPAASAILAD